MKKLSLSVLDSIEASLKEVALSYEKELKKISRDESRSFDEYIAVSKEASTASKAELVADNAAVVSVIANVGGNSKRTHARISFKINGKRASRAAVLSLIK